MVTVSYGCFSIELWFLLAACTYLFNFFIKFHFWYIVSCDSIQIQWILRTVTCWQYKELPCRFHQNGHLSEHFSHRIGSADSETII